MGDATPDQALNGEDAHIEGLLEVDGMIHADGGMTGNVTGNAATATALADNGGNCSAGQAPLGVDAQGAAESCFDVWTEAENRLHGQKAIMALIIQ